METGLNPPAGTASVADAHLPERVSSAPVPDAESPWWQPVFRIGERVWDGADLLRFAVCSGRWEWLAGRCREGLTRYREAEAQGGLPDAGAVNRVIEELRYRLNLIAADEAGAWMRSRGLDWESVRAWAARRILRHQRKGGPLKEYPPEGSPAAPEFWWPEAVCSGWWKATVDELAGRAAVRDKFGSASVDRAAQAGLIDEFRDRMGRGGYPQVSISLDQCGEFAEMELCFRRFEQDASALPALRRILERHRLNWVKFETLCLRYPTEERAREALLCIREDGADAAEVSNWTSAGMRHRQFYVNQLPPGLRDEVMASRTGDLIGPTPLDGGFTILEIHGRTEPSLDDPHIRQWAITQAMERALGYEIDNRITWIEPA